MSLADDLPVGLPIDPVPESEWNAWRRQIIDDFARHVFGPTPELDVTVSLELLDRQTAFGAGTRSRYALTITASRGSHTIELLVFLPNTDNAPVFVGLNFDGNDDAEQKWPIRLLLEHGFGVATVHAADLEPDRADGAADGVRSILPVGDGRWGTIGVWAWGLSLVRAQLADLAHVRDDAIIAIGHSRMGKAALWAAAQDDRFGAVISNESGCSGDSLHRHPSGEDVAAITSRFPYWFTPGYTDYAGREHDLPVDQHQLLASIAPRPLYVSSAAADDWADPVGQFLAVLAARRIQQDRGPIGFHLRPGGHDLTIEDWSHFMSFLNTHLG